MAVGVATDGAAVEVAARGVASVVLPRRVKADGATTRADPRPIRALVPGTDPMLNRTTTTENDVKHTIQTGLDLARSKQAIEKAMDAYKARFSEYNPRFDWTTDSSGEFGFKAKGVSLGGTISVRDNAVDVDMDVPFLFRIFQGKAMEVIADEVSVWVEKAKKGELE